MQLLNVKLNTLTADHPQIEGQSENLIRTLANMRRGFIQKIQEDWDRALSQIEFEYNASRHGSTGLSPFQVDIGRIPHNAATRSLATCKIQCKSAYDVVQRPEAYTRLVKDHLSVARAKQKQDADRHRRDVTCNVGDLVLLRTDSLNIARRADLPEIWQTKIFGQLLIIEVMGPVTYKIELPPSMKRAQNLFHVFKLRQYHSSSDRYGQVSKVIDAKVTLKKQ